MDNFTKLSTHLPKALPPYPYEPEHGVSRLGFLTPEEAFWQCEKCGPVVPHFVKLTGRWLRGTCDCLAELEKAQHEEARRVAKYFQTLRENFEWLGERWSDMPLKEKTLDNFEQVRQPDAYDAVQYFLVDMHGSLILHSETFGTGKTHLLAAIVNELRVNGKASRFTTAPKLFRAIQQRIDHNEEYISILHKAIRTPLLVIDDVDKAKPSEWKLEMYFEIVDERTKAGLPIALSTNRLADLATFVGGAACSRLSMGQIAVQMNGADYRMEV